MKNRSFTDPVAKISLILEGKDALLTVNQVAKLLGTTNSQVRYMVRLRDLNPVFDIAITKRSDYRIPQSVIREFLLSRII